MSSEQVAAVLRQCGRQVRLIVARPVGDPNDPVARAAEFPLVPTAQLDENVRRVADALDRGADYRLAAQTLRSAVAPSANAPAAATSAAAPLNNSSSPDV